MNQLITFGPHKNIEPINRRRVVVLWGDILHHNGFDYVCEYDPSRNPRLGWGKEPVGELGVGNRWTPIMVIGDVPAIEYDKENIEPVGFLSGDIVLWKVKE